MSGFRDASLESVVQACQFHASSLGTAFSRALQRTLRVEVGAHGPWSSEHVPPDLKGPGVAATFCVGQEGMLGLIPADLFPAQRSPSQPGEQTRLDRLALDWSLHCVPETVFVEQSTTVVTEHLQAEVEAATPDAAAQWLELRLCDPELEGADPVGRVYLVWPVLTPPQPAIEEERFELPPSSVPGLGVPKPPVSRRNRLERLRQLPVQISVRLAEKKIELGQLLSITTGSLITFNKSCEDLLDLYVNNTLYCRGEAVKIGEKFGLKINELGARPVREERIVGG